MVAYRGTFNLIDYMDDSKSDIKYDSWNIDGEQTVVITFKSSHLKSHVTTAGNCDIRKVSDPLSVSRSMLME